jgi:hypothetical protein
LLHTETGALRLAPLYDVMSTRFYPTDDHLAMYVDSVQKADRVTPERVVTEAARWGIRRPRVQEIVSDVLDRLPAAVNGAADETEGVPQELIDLVLARIVRLSAAAADVNAS